MMQTAAIAGLYIGVISSTSLLKVLLPSRVPAASKSCGILFGMKLSRTHTARGSPSPQDPQFVLRRAALTGIMYKAAEYTMTCQSEDLCGEMHKAIERPD